MSKSFGSKKIERPSFTKGIARFRIRQRSPHGLKEYFSTTSLNVSSFFSTITAASLVSFGKLWAHVAAIDSAKAGTICVLYCENLVMIGSDGWGYKGGLNLTAITLSPLGVCRGEDNNPLFLRVSFPFLPVMVICPSLCIP